MTRPPRPYAASLLLAVTGLGACTQGSGAGPDPSSIRTGATSDSSNGVHMTPIRLTVGDRIIDATLNDSATAADLAGRLPLTLPLRDFRGQEKLAQLDRPLTMEGVPSADHAQANDIGYYAPDGVIVLYTMDVGRYEGIVRLGRVGAADMAFLADQPDGFVVTIDRA